LQLFGHRSLIGYDTWNPERPGRGLEDGWPSFVDGTG
jgi:hypothetical protein